MSDIQFLALAGFAAAAITALLVTQSKHRADWPAWAVPACVAVPFIALTGLAFAREGAASLWSMLTGSLWGLQLWYGFILSVAAGFFLLQNRARAAGMKSEVWVLLVIFTGGIGLLLMLARTLYLERQHARRDAREPMLGTTTTA